MILPDVNALVYAFRVESRLHEPYREWLDGLVSGDDELALVDAVLSGVVRVATNRAVFDDPTPVSEATDFVEWLLAAARPRWIPSGPETWRQFRRFADSDPGIRGNRVPDAYLAAVAVTHGARLATADRGFARFPGLRFFDPTSPT